MNDDSIEPLARRRIVRRACTARSSRRRSLFALLRGVGVNAATTACWTVERR
jgi:hypothetical protein